MATKADSFMGAMRGLFVKRFALSNETPTDIGIDNATWFSGRNAANTADVNIARVNSSNEVELGSVVNATRITASLGVQTTATAHTATADGTGTGTIAAGTGYVTVTSADANNIIVLPAPVIGHVVRLMNGATGYELRTSDPATIAINGGSGAGAESAIAANTLVTCVCTSATTWVCMSQVAAGTVSATQVAAA